VFLARNGFEAHGFDNSEYAVKAARKALRGEGLTAKVRLCDMEKGLPYKSGSFDAVIAVRAMYQARVETIHRLADEVDRTLRKGGYVYPESKQTRLCYRSKDCSVRKVEPGTYEWLNGNGYYHFFRKDELRNLFKGYRTVRFYFKSRTYYVLMQKPY
jgi:ubiquinone/menaquinone biosynthesis C-methylase UbiE